MMITLDGATFEVLQPDTTKTSYEVTRDGRTFGAFWLQRAGGTVTSGHHHGDNVDGETLLQVRDRYLAAHPEIVERLSRYPLYLMLLQADRGGRFPTARQLAELCNVSEDRIAEVMAPLADAGFIEANIARDGESGRTLLTSWNPRGSLSTMVAVVMAARQRGLDLDMLV